ncbi:MAG: efflux RND transporter periplasmic adaptor subunit [Gammaproteobacteria bacterium]|nr:efflux RND transporter periplasmic adaptor subunit [Gammaproteobacteria bacterium]
MAESDDRGNRLIGVFQVAALAVVVVVGIYFARAPERLAVDPSYALGTTAAPPAVSVVQPVPSSHAARVSLTGTVGPHGLLAMMLSNRPGGRVTWISPAMRFGGTFKAGEVLLKIESKDYELAVADAEAEVRQAKARLEQRKLEGASARAEYRASHPGVEVPPLIAHLPQIARAQARLDEELIRLETRQLALSRTEFSLPFDGRISRAQVSVGQVLTAGTPFGTAYAKDSMEVGAKIAYDDLAYLQPAVGRAATIITEDQAFPGEVVRISAEVDVQSRMPRLFLKFADAVPLESIPLPGSFATVIIEGPAFDDAFLLPDAAEQPGGRVWIVNRGTLMSVSPTTLRQAVTGWLDSPGWLVRTFDTGDGVVVGSVFGAHDGMQVSIAAD